MGFRELVTRVQQVTVRTFAGGDIFTYTPFGLASVQVEGVFTEPHTYIDVRTSVEISSEAPTLGVRASDLPRAPMRDDSIAGTGRLAGRAWRVSDTQYDGEGIWTLILIETT